jgi:PhzF family phenazine biosynthesis protein
MTRTRPFAQVDVFTAVPYKGNALAVVLNGAGLSDGEMAAFARWTNLSETTFIQPATDPAADYRLRIFTTASELPFAGHPTLGSAHAWLEARGVPQGDDVVQECGAGLVRIRRAEGRLAFAAPPLVRSGAVDEGTQRLIADALGLDMDDLLDAAWLDNGPGWVGVRLRDASAVRAVVPQMGLIEEHGLKIGVVGLWNEGNPIAAEVRAFIPGEGIAEDPVTGSLNAGIAQWLIPAGVLPDSYVAGQGWAVARDGRIHVERVGEDFWIGGDSVTCIRGSVEL